MNLINKHLDKNNLHHAYLIEGKKENIEPEILEFINKSLNIKTSGNPDFYRIFIDNFKIDDAFSLRSMGSMKSFSGDKKIFVVCVNTFSLDAEGVLLKMFEEPIEDTHIFLVVPSIDSLIKTLVSRFYVIKSGENIEEELKIAQKFISMKLQDRILFIKEFIADAKDDEEEETIEVDSARAKSIKFLNALEVVLNNNIFKNKDFNNFDFFEQIFKVRQFLRQPGSSAKTLLESVAISIPIL